MVTGKIVISEDLWMPLLSEYGREAAVEVVYDWTLVHQREALFAHGPGTRALIIRNQTKVDADLLAHFPDLCVIGRLGVGLDNIDVGACRRRGIDVVSARGYNANAVAEYVMTCLLSHARPLQQWGEQVRAGQWNRMAAMGGEIYGKTLGLIGIGDIGQRVASRARACGVRVVAYDPFVLSSHAVVRDCGVTLLSLESVLAQSHFVSLHIPLTSETRGLLDCSALRGMRSDSVIINTARGGIIDEEALAQVLQDEPNRFAYLDVRTVEPPAPHDVLLQRSNVCVTPHIAGITQESAQEVGAFVLEQVMLALSGVRPLGIVN